MRAVRRMAYLSIATSLATIVLKFGAYFLTGSVSLWSDALESLVNLAAGLVALGALMVAEQPADDRHAYGHDKAEYFSSGVEGALILVAAVSIIWSAVHRLIDPQPLARLGPGIVVAFLAGAANFVDRAHHAEGRAAARQHHDRGRREAPADRRLDLRRHHRRAARRDGDAAMGDPRPADGDRRRHPHHRHGRQPAAALGRRVDGCRVAAGGGDARRDADPRGAAGGVELSCAAHAQGRGAALPRVPPARARHDERPAIRIRCATGSKRR